MKKLVRALIVVSILLFVVGAGCVIAGFAMGVNSGDVKEVVEKYIPYIDFIHRERIEYDSEGESVQNNAVSNGTSYSFSLDEVRELEIDLVNADCEILPSENEDIIIDVEDNNKYVSIDLNGTNLEIICDPAIWNQSGANISIYLPQELQLNELYMTVGSGQVNVNTDIYAKDIYVEMGAAAIVSENTVKAERFELEVGAGDAQFYYVDASDIRIENAAGESRVVLAGQKEMYNVRMEVAAGEVVYGDESYAGLAHEYSNSPKDAVRNIDIECAAGAAKITFQEGIDI